MKLIDRLLMKVQTQAERLSIAFITLDEISGLYKADCRLWDGVAGSGGRAIVSEHETEQGAWTVVNLRLETK